MLDKKDLIVAVDLGGTHFRVMLADRDGRMVARVRGETEAADGPEVVEKRLVAAVHEVLNGRPVARVAGVGIAAPGPIDPWTGVLYNPPNLPGWNEMPLRDRLQERLGLSVWAGNDANLAALGEHRFGCGQDVDDLVYLTISTGIGGGIISRGELLWGSHGLAAEAGHIILQPDGPLCGCGQHGCLEALASGPAIGRRATEQIAAGKTSTLQPALRDGKSLTGQQVVNAARMGDRLALAVLQQAAVYIGMGIATLVHLLDPAIVVIGGGVSNAGELLLDPIRQTVRAYTMEAYHDGVTIVPTALGDDVGLWGAVALVMDRLAV